jgi:hypothetical protein
MTRTTPIYLNEAHDPEQLLRWINTNLLHSEDVLTKVEPKALVNQPGQGLSAWVWITHNDGEKFDGLYMEDPERDDYNSDRDFQKAVAENRRIQEMYTSQYVCIDFDTAYGYRGPEGGASGLHASFIRKLREYLPESTTITWYNESAVPTRCWFTDLDGLDTLE